MSNSHSDSKIIEKIQKYHLKQWVVRRQKFKIACVQLSLEIKKRRTKASPIDSCLRIHYLVCQEYLCETVDFPEFCKENDFFKNCSNGVALEKFEKI